MAKVEEFNRTPEDADFSADDPALQKAARRSKDLLDFLEEYLQTSRRMLLRSGSYMLLQTFLVFLGILFMGFMAYCVREDLQLAHQDVKRIAAESSMMNRRPRELTRNPGENSRDASPHSVGAQPALLGNDGGRGSE